MKIAGIEGLRLGLSHAQRKVPSTVRAAGFMIVDRRATMVVPRIIADAGQYPNRLVLDFFVTTGRSGREPDGGARAPDVP